MIHVLFFWKTRTWNVLVKSHIHVCHFFCTVLRGKTYCMKATTRTLGEKKGVSGTCYSHEWQEHRCSSWVIKNEDIVQPPQPPQCPCYCLISYSMYCTVHYEFHLQSICIFCILYLKYCTCDMKRWDIVLGFGFLLYISYIPWKLQGMYVHTLFARSMRFPKIHKNLMGLKNN